ncbi:MAG: hypothetical protein HY553_00090, partial [Elusimicrobia bacterium]|nr:hypothetical protein [Elusimicrobiota bacterium]
MKRALSLLLCAAVLVGAPGFEAARAFAQVVGGAAGVVAPVGGSAGAGVAGAVPGGGPGAGLRQPVVVTLPGRPGLLNPVVLPAGRMGTVAVFRAPAAGSAPGASPTAARAPSQTGLALPLSRVAPAGVAAAALGERSSERGPPGSAFSRLANRSAAEVSGTGGESETLGLRAREDARFDGTKPVDGAGEFLAPFAPRQRALAAFRAAANPAAEPGAGRLLPAAPGERPKPAQEPVMPPRVELSSYRQPASTA